MTQSSFPRVAFIYAITHLASGRAYIGSAWHPQRRWIIHRNGLRKGEHHCRYLQRAWARYGEAAFAFSVIDQAVVVSPAERHALECAWIAREKRYNTTVANHDGTKFVLSKSQVAAIRTVSLAMWADLFERHRIVDAIKAAWADAPERKKRLTQQLKERHANSSPEERNRLARWMQTDEGRAWIVSRNNEWWADEANREEMRRKAKERCTPEFMAKCRAAGAGRKSPKETEKQRERLRKRMADPAEVAKIQEVIIAKGIARLEADVAAGIPISRTRRATGREHIERLSPGAAAAVARRKSPNGMNIRRERRLAQEQLSLDPA